MSGNKEQGTLVDDINQAWVMARAERPYRDRMAALKQVAYYALQKINETGLDEDISKNEIRKTVGLSRFDVISEKVLGVDQVIYPQYGKPALVDVMNMLYPNSLSNMWASFVAEKAIDLHGFFYESSEKAAKKAAKNYLKSQKALKEIDKLA